MRLLKQKGSLQRKLCRERRGKKPEVYNCCHGSVQLWQQTGHCELLFPFKQRKRATALKHSLRCSEHKNEMRERERKTVRWKAVVGHKMQREKHRCGMSGVECSEEEFLLAVSE